METYWDAYLREIAEGRVITGHEDTEGELHEYPLVLARTSPADLLENFYHWLHARGLFKDGV